MSGKVKLLSLIIVIVLSLPFFGRNWNLFMHQLGAVMFVGNILVSAVWMGLARRSGNPEALRLGIRGVIVTDDIFISPGVLLLILNGGILGTPYFQAHASWLFAGIALLAASGILWGAVLAPIQKKLARALGAMPAGGPVPPEVAPLLARWFKVGGIATLLPLIALALMVIKPTF